MNIVLKVFLITLLSIIGILLIGMLIIWINSPGRLPALKDSQHKIIPGAISEKVWIDVNGIKQGMFIRGENPQNPVILYLHGGPGTPLLPFISYLEESERMEKYFTMCYWDQRGSGMTYSSSTDPSTMTLEQMIEDTREVTAYLKERFGQEKIYLIGHSWGSYLGVKTIEKYPGDYLAYIGIGQLSNQRESERLAYEYMLNHAKDIGDKEVIEKLEKFDPDADSFPQNEYLISVRTAIVNKYGLGMMHEGVSFFTIVKALAAFKGYTVPEKINWFLGADFSMIYLYDRVVMKDNLFESSPKFEIPFYITQGVYDYQVSYVLAENYLNILDAPKKAFFTFDKSAHSPNMEEPGKFIQVVRHIAEENPGNRE